MIILRQNNYSFGSAVRNIGRAARRMGKGAFGGFMLSAIPGMIVGNFSKKAGFAVLGAGIAMGAAFGLWWHQVICKDSDNADEYVRAHREELEKFLSENLPTEYTKLQGFKEAFTELRKKHILEARKRFDYILNSGLEYFVYLPYFYIPDHEMILKWLGYTFSRDEDIKETSMPLGELSLYVPDTEVIEVPAKWNFGNHTWNINSPVKEINNTRDIQVKWSQVKKNWLDLLNSEPLIMPMNEIWDYCALETWDWEQEEFEKEAGEYIKLVKSQNAEIKKLIQTKL